MKGQLGVKLLANQPAMVYNQKQQILPEFKQEQKRLQEVEATAIGGEHILVY